MSTKPHHAPLPRKVVATPVSGERCVSTLQAMAEAGEVDAIRTDDGETLFRKCGPRHHHHLVCRNCGLTVELEGPSVERWATKAAEDHGFSDVKHTLELFGLCADCSRHI